MVRRAIIAYFVLVFNFSDHCFAFSDGWVLSDDGTYFYNTTSSSDGTNERIFLFAYGCFFNKLMQQHTFKYIITANGVGDRCSLHGDGSTPVRITTKSQYRQDYLFECTYNSEHNILRYELAGHYKTAIQNLFLLNQQISKQNQNNIEIELTDVRASALFSMKNSALLKTIKCVP